MGVKRLAILKNQELMERYQNVQGSKSLVDVDCIYVAKNKDK